MSAEDRVDGLRETRKTIASDCDVTFELYCTLASTLYHVVTKQKEN